MAEEKLPPIPGISEKDFPKKKVRRSCTFGYSKDVFVDIGPEEEKWIKWGSVKELDKLLEKEYPRAFKVHGPAVLYLNRPKWITDALKKTNPNIMGWKIPSEIKCETIKIENEGEKND